MISLSTHIFESGEASLDGISKSKVYVSCGFGTGILS